MGHVENINKGATAKIAVRVGLLVFFLLWSVFSLQAQLSRPDDPIDSESKDIANIYLDFTGASLGRSPYRRLRLALELSALVHYRSYPVAEPKGWSTAVFVGNATEQKLSKGELPISRYIKIRGGVYYLDYRGIRLAFALEVPPQAVFDTVAKTYESLPEIGKIVAKRYRSGYTVRIYEAENVLEPENQFISYPEAILAATIVGDKEQWLWGIHDGRDLLNYPIQPARY